MSSKNILQIKNIFQNKFSINKDLIKLIRKTIHVSFEYYNKLNNGHPKIHKNL